MPKADEKLAQAQKLAAKLRENLKRRKAQARARSVADAAEPAPKDAGKRSP